MTVPAAAGKPMTAATVRPLVTIVTATRNHAETLVRAIESVRGQSYDGIEHIIVDGMSTDGTGNIVRRFESLMDRRLVYVREADGGMYEAINKGIRRATGEIIGILNSDDWYCPDAIGKVVAHFSGTGADVVFGNIRCVSRDPSGAETSREWRANVDGLNSHMSIPHPGVFVRTAVYHRLGPFNECYKIAADYEFLLRLRAGGVAMAQLDAVLCNFQVGGMSQARLWRVVVETFKIQRTYLGVIRASGIFCRRAVEYWVLRWILRLVRGAESDTRRYIP